jgi:hypothetical protein
MDRASKWAERRAAPVVATVVMLVLVMTYSLLAHSLFHVGTNTLVSPSDLWSLTNSSSAILHGHFSEIYVRHGALTSPPALEFVLVPVVGLGQLVGLSPHLRVSGEPLSLWFVVGPVAILLASTVFFAIDAIARSWRLSEGRRVVLALVSALGVANVVGFWGHPEDCVAVAFVLWAALTMERFGAPGARRAALLLGLGIAFQPLAVLGVAAVLARLSWRAAAGLWWRLVLPSLAVLVLPLLAETHDTLFVLVRQPFQPRYISLTPLTALANHLGPGLDGGGMTRLVAIVVASLLGVLVCHRRHSLPSVLALISFAFFLRIALETEMNWYYLWPVAALCLLLSMRGSTVRFGVCSLALGASMVLGDRRVHDIVAWWPLLMATAVVMLLAAAPAPGQWPGLAAGLRAARGTTRPVKCNVMKETVGAGQRRA